MRLMQRTTVDLPEPEGPMSAVTRLGAKSMVKSLMLWRSPYQAFRPRTVMRCPAAVAAGRPSVPAAADGAASSGLEAPVLICSDGSVMGVVGRLGVIRSSCWLGDARRA